MSTMDMITNAGIDAIITPEIRNEVIEDIVKESVILRHFTRLPNMTTSQQEIRILDTLPVTYWVDGNTGFKKTSSLEWEAKRITAQEIAVIIPVAINNVRDSAVDIWNVIRRAIVENFHKKIDEAIIIGKDKPPMFRASLVDTIINVGAHFSSTTNFYNDMDLAMSKVENCGYIPNAIMGGVGLRSDLRRVVDTTGQPIYASWLDGLDKIYVDNSAWDSTKAKYIVGDFKKCVYSIRQDIEFEIFTQGVVSDPTTGAVVYNLMQQDMIAVRCTMRLGWEVPNPVNILEPDSSIRFPLAMVDATPALATQNVTFTVTDGANAVKGAKISMGGVRGETDESGLLTLKSQPSQKYNYTVKAEGFSTAKGKIEVENEDKSVEIVLR